MTTKPPRVSTTADGYHERFTQACKDQEYLFKCYGGVLDGREIFARHAMALEVSLWVGSDSESTTNQIVDEYVFDMSESGEVFLGNRPDQQGKFCKVWRESPGAARKWVSQEEVSGRSKS